MENFTVENEFNNSIQNLSFDDSEQNDFNSIFEKYFINENFSNALFNDENNINNNNLLELPINKVSTEPDSDKKIINKNNEVKDTLKIKNKNIINNIIMINKKRGRRKIGENNKEKANHTK